MCDSKIRTGTSESSRRQIWISIRLKFLISQALHKQQDLPWEVIKFRVFSHCSLSMPTDRQRMERLHPGVSMTRTAPLERLAARQRCYFHVNKELAVDILHRI